MLSKRAISWIIFALFAALYIWTMCPTVYTMDCGELILAAYRLQIAHTTGYPLFCILGKIGTILIPIGSIAWRINAMNALFAAGAVSILFLALCQVTRKPVALFVASLFAVSPIFWDVATSAEVHALSSFLIATELLLFLKWRRTGNNRLLCYLALTAGLAMTNHLSSALILPGILFGVFQRDRSVFRDRAFVVRSLLLFVLPLSLYVYFPLRAAASRGHIWGDIYAASGFWAYATGKWFRTRMFSMTSIEIWQNTLKFLRLVIAQFPIYLAWVIPLGAVLIRRRHGRLLGALVIMAVMNVVYNINYRIPDIEPYYVPTMFALSICAAVGINYLIEQRNRNSVRVLTLLALPVILLSVMFVQFPRANKRDARFIMDYAENALKTPGKNALVIACGDSCFNAMMYAREVNGERPDIIIAHREILRAWPMSAREWTARHYYDAVSAQSPAMREFRWSSRKYSRLDIYDEKYLADVVLAVLKERPVYIICTGNDFESHPIMRQLKDTCELLPEGMLFRVYPKSQKVDLAKLADRNEKLWKSYRTRRIYDGSIQGGELEREVPDRYAVFHIALGDTELRAGMFTRAEKNFRKALTINQDMTRARNGLGVALACQRNYREASKEWQTILLRHPDDPTAQRGLRMTQVALMSELDARSRVQE